MHTHIRRHICIHVHLSPPPPSPLCGVNPNSAASTLTHRDTGRGVILCYTQIHTHNPICIYINLSPPPLPLCTVNIIIINSTICRLCGEPESMMIMSG